MCRVQFHEAWTGLKPCRALPIVYVLYNHRALAVLTITLLRIGSYLTSTNICMPCSHFIFGVWLARHNPPSG
jgi:hypothetical protein